LSLAGLLMATPASAEEQTISIPRDGWETRLDAPQLTPSKDGANSVFNGRSDRLQISVFVESPRCPGGDSDENVYECFAEALRKDLIAVWDSQHAHQYTNGT